MPAQPATSSDALPRSPAARATTPAAPKRKPSTLSDQHAMLRATKAGAAKEEADREKLRFAARRLTEQWVARNGDDVYAMMRSAHHFMDVFSGGDPLHGSELKAGDAVSLKKAYHKLATRLHPDRHQHSALGVQVQAEEIFKLISSKYQQESDRLLSV